MNFFLNSRLMKNQMYRSVIQYFYDEILTPLLASIKLYNLIQLSGPCSDIQKNSLAYDFVLQLLPNLLGSQLVSKSPDSFAFQKIREHTSWQHASRTFLYSYLLGYFNCKPDFWNFSINWLFIPSNFDTH